MPAFDSHVPPMVSSPTKMTAEPSRGVQSAPADANASTRFPISPSANGRTRPSAEPAAASPSSRPGHITAGAFQNRQISPSLGGSTPPAGALRQGSQPSRNNLSASVNGPGAAAGDDDDENDPLVKALRVLQSTPIQASPRARSSVDLRNSAAAQGQPQSTQRPSGHATQHSFGSTRSRPGSPEKQQAAQQAPSQTAQPRARTPSYPQPQSQPQYQARPASRAGSSVPTEPAAAAPSNRYSTSATHLASPPPASQYSARPPSPSRGVQSSTQQPFIPPSLRPSSPLPGANPARSSSPAAQTPVAAQNPAPYGTSPSQIAYASPPPPQNVYGTSAGTAPQSPYGYSPGGPPPHAQAVQGPPPTAAPYRAVSPAARPASVVAPPVGYNGMQPQQPYMAQAPSQHFQPAPSPHPQQPSPHAAYQSPSPVTYAPPAAQSPYAQMQFPGRSSTVGSYASPAQQAPLGRTLSTHSGVSGVSAQPTAAQAYQQQQQQPQQQQYHQPPPQQQQLQQQQQPPAQYHQPAQLQQAPAQHLSQQPSQPSMPRAQSVASLRAGHAAAPPPTGQYTETGQPILFYVSVRSLRNVSRTN